MPQVAKQLDQSILEFGIRLFKSLGENCTRNIVISPIAVQTVLTIMYNGAQAETLKVMTKNLNFDGISPTVDTLAKAFSKLVTPILVSYDIQMATGIYVNDLYSVHQVWAYEATKEFLTDVQMLKFSNPRASAKTINNYVNNITFNKIPDLVQPDWFNSNTSVVLVNALYMNGPWKHPFDEDVEQDVPFRNDLISCDKPTSTVDMMHVQVYKMRNIYIFKLF